MIKIKHVFDRVERDDGQRMWVEPIGLTKDLRSMCSVDHVMPHLGPPRELWEWFEEHRDGYEYFRGQYHEFLAKSAYAIALQHMACAALRGEPLTLLHASDDPEHNAATALHEYLTELEAWCPPDGA